jgi:hypothetical protein
MRRHQDVDVVDLQEAELLDRAPEVALGDPAAGPTAIKALGHECHSPCFAQ